MKQNLPALACASLAFISSMVTLSSYVLQEITLVHLRGCLCIQYVYVALLRNFTEIIFTE